MSAGPRPVRQPARLLILGAGLVAGPLVRHFLERTAYRLTVASLALEDARSLVGEHPRGVARQIDVAAPHELESVVAEADLVISLVPYAHHVTVARVALAHGVSLITTSYVSPEMRALDEEARRAGVLLLNEVGLDPGLDHMSALRLIRAAQAAGGSVVSFRSSCGGLPAPESANNPWRYKFSWSPRGVLLAARLPARYLGHGRVISVPGETLFEHGRPIRIDGVGELELYPNRDSLGYVDTYGICGTRDMLRATLRYPGWCETLRAVAALGLLDVAPAAWPAGTSWREWLSGRLPAGAGTLEERLCRRFGVTPDHELIERLAWAGLLADEPLPAPPASPLDALAERLQARMTYGPGERDMVVLRHEVDVCSPDGRRERLVSQHVSFGDPGGESATSRTVSLPAAVAAELLLEGGLSARGVQIPITAEIYEPILDRLARLGIRFAERSEPAHDPRGSSCGPRSA